jgi:hypothetical protein
MLCNDRDMGDILDPFVSTFFLLDSSFLIKQQLGCNNGNWVFSRGPRRDVISKGQSQFMGSSVREFVKKGLDRVKLKNLHC